MLLIRREVLQSERRSAVDACNITDSKISLGSHLSIEFSKTEGSLRVRAMRAEEGNLVPVTVGDTTPTKTCTDHALRNGEKLREGNMCYGLR